MALVKISFVVSFSSQDSKYPSENLLSEDGILPKEHSRQLSVELQRERASPIAYVDVGNYGCAFLQIEVGCSLWPCDQPYLTLVPTVTLMTPADSKTDHNCYGVQMFKEADFLELMVGQKWDCVQLTCSQPFSPCSHFSLSVIRLRTPQEQKPDPPRPPLDAEDAELSDRPWFSSPAFHRTFFPKPYLRSREEEQLRSCLQKLEGAAWSPGCLSLSARMALLAARNQAQSWQEHPEGVTQSCQPRMQEVPQCQALHWMSLQPSQAPPGGWTGTVLPALLAQGSSCHLKDTERKSPSLWPSRETHQEE